MSLMENEATEKLSSKAEGGTFAIMELKEKKKAEEIKPDPDADCSDDELDEDNELDYCEIDEEDEEQRKKPSKKAVVKSDAIYLDIECNA